MEEGKLDIFISPHSSSDSFGRIGHPQDFSGGIISKQKRVCFTTLYDCIILEKEVEELISSFKCNVDESKSIYI